MRSAWVCVGGVPRPPSRRSPVPPPLPVLLAELGAWNAPEPRSAWEPAARRSHTRQFQQKQPAVRPRRTVGFGSALELARRRPAVRGVRYRCRVTETGSGRPSYPEKGRGPRQQAADQSSKRTKLSGETCVSQQISLIVGVSRNRMQDLGRRTLPSLQFTLRPRRGSKLVAFAAC